MIYKEIRHPIYDEDNFSCSVISAKKEGSNKSYNLYITNYNGELWDCDVVRTRDKCKRLALHQIKGAVTGDYKVEFVSWNQRDESYKSAQCQWRKVTSDIYVRSGLAFDGNYVELRVYKSSDGPYQCCITSTDTRGNILYRRCDGSGDIRFQTLAKKQSLEMFKEYGKLGSHYARIARIKKYLKFGNIAAPYSIVGDDWVKISSPRKRDVSSYSWWGNMIVDKV